MKVLIVRTFPSIMNFKTYNIQEIGLAKALCVAGHECGVVFYNGFHANKTEHYSFSQDGRNYGFSIYWLKGVSFFKNGIMPSVKKIVPYYDVIQVHEYDQIMSWYMYTWPKKPTIVYHGPYFHEYAKGYNLKCQIFDNLFLKWRKLDQVIVMTKSELAKEFITSKGFNNVYTVGVGIDDDNFKNLENSQVKCRLEHDESKFRLLYVGKIEERRNVYFLLKVFELLREIFSDIELVIVGDGERDYVSKFEETIEPLVKQGIIKYYKKASQQELALFYQRVNLFLFTSNYEIFGMVLLEAMYFGIPVISSWNGGASTLIKNRINGIVMDGFCLKDWVNSIIMLRNDSIKYCEMRKAAEETVKEKFLWERLVDHFIKRYDEAIKRYDNKE